MECMNADLISGHLSELDLDVRKSNNGRFMDQKVTPDNLSFIADCIVNAIGSNTAKEFTTRDIWTSQYFIENVQAIYNKPNPGNPLARREYDKFIGQPLRLLAYAGVLKDKRVGSKLQYSLNSRAIIDYIALREINALVFLNEYLTKVLSDSDMIVHFENFKNSYESGNLTPSDLENLRQKYARFIRGHTGIRKDLEIMRIFNKILNIYSAARQLPGVQSGKLTDFPMVFSDLSYNAINWRDLKKRKNLPRKAAESVAISEKFSNYEMKKAKDAIKKRHFPNSEVSDSFSKGDATQVHHIFPDAAFPQYRATLENLILLTPNQHNLRAHPNNNNQLVDEEYQKVCLLAKSRSIEESDNNGDGFYSLDIFKEMLNETKRYNLDKSSGYPEIRDKLSLAP